MGTGLSIVGSLIPFEGQLLILPGSGLAALGAWLARGSFRVGLPVAFAITAVGLALMQWVSSLGGVGVITG
jgi:hypothetical protein